MGARNRDLETQPTKVISKCSGEAEDGWRASQKMVGEYKLEFVFVISIPSKLSGEGNRGGDKAIREVCEYSAGNTLGAMGNGL